MDKKPQFERHSIVTVDNDLDKQYKVDGIVCSEHLGFMYHLGPKLWVAEERIQLHEIANSPLYKLMKEEF